MDTYNEKEIIALLQDPKRQREAFECIVKQYSEQLYWQIRRMVLSHDDANDLLQNTFIKAWINIDYFRAEAKMSTWLYRIALNECLTFLNKQRANNQLSIDEAMPKWGINWKETVISVETKPKDYSKKHYIHYPTNNE